MASELKKVFTFENLENGYPFPTYLVRSINDMRTTVVFKLDDKTPWLCCECLGGGVVVGCAHCALIKDEFSFIVDPKLVPADRELCRTWLDTAEEMSKICRDDDHALLAKLRNFCYPDGSTYANDYLAVIATDAELAWFDAHRNILLDLEAVLSDRIVGNYTRRHIRRIKRIFENNLDLMVKAIEERNAKLLLLLEDVKKDIEQLHIDDDKENIPPAIPVIHQVDLEAQDL